MKRFISFAGAVVLSISCFGQSDDSYKAFLSRVKAEEERYLTKVRKGYEEYLARADAEYKAYMNSIGKVWGRADAVTDTRSKWVEYGSDFESRSIVDFKDGEIIVEVAVDDATLDDGDKVNGLIAEAVDDLLESRGSTCSYSTEVETVEPLTEKPVLDGLVDLSRYSMPDKSGYGKGDLRQVAKAIVDQSPKTVKTVIGDDGSERAVVQIRMNMVTDNLSRNAMLYKDYIAEFSEKYQIEQPLILAVIEQESNFNPRATSHAPAYGLMQLVPRSGGYDAYRYVYNRNWAPSRSYLYNPKNNIELGTAYLRILTDQFSDVTDPECRRLCVIAGYNTGAGNVSRAFTGNTSVSKAVFHINLMDYDRLYHHLTHRLSTAEARSYVAGVTKKREKYLK